MTKREYAEAIATLVNGTVNEVEKANGVKKMGVFRKLENGASPTVYIDDMFTKGLTVDEAAQEVSRLFIANPSFDFDTTTVTDFEKVKPNLRVRLFNNKTNAEVFKSAEEYGFDDLIITPYILVGQFMGNTGTIKVGTAMLDTWGVTADEVIQIGMENSKAEGYRIQSMYEIMIEMMGAEQAELMGLIDDGRMYVLSNKDKTFGAIGAILIADELKEKFSSGYVVIPSSIHEVIIVPKDIGDREVLDGMVNEVNTTAVLPEEVLGSKVYIF